MDTLHGWTREKKWWKREPDKRAGPEDGRQKAIVDVVSVSRRLRRLK